ncbi:aromatic-ring-hydroxylating dioxygenase subunit beta [Kordiimonas pumila]|uniref:Aromatic-ring-hydroxylating dioxygenase subunit beta n=1 Tax=Kordiimonas pumila TaxID=2161677 RepID=A0ABV7D3X8_9PROT|nr:aromatic-ring-hydroxylating dioxygenase subunit beta [Kordiimonas pumila]
MDMQSTGSHTYETLRAFYTDYMIVLDDFDLEKWPDFFTDDCFYRVTAKENWDAGNAFSAMRCESKGMLIDRVVGIQQTMMFAPRYLRRFQSALKVVDGEGDTVSVRSNFLCIQTLVDEPSEVAFCGVAFDKVKMLDSGPKLIERICVLDTEMILNSLIYPL